MNTKALRQKILDLAIHGKLLSGESLPLAPTAAAFSATPSSGDTPQRPENCHTDSELLRNSNNVVVEFIETTNKTRHAEPKNAVVSRASTTEKRAALSGLTRQSVSEDEIPFELPEGWAWKRLGEIYSHTTGKALKKSNQKGTLRKYITTSNLYWNHFDFTDVRSMYFTDEELDKCTAKKGDLLVCNGGDVGRAAIWNFDYDICYQNHISRLRPKTDEIDNKFYFYVIWRNKEKGNLNGKGIGITSLSASDLLSMLVPLPPLAEQQLIVAKIEEIFAQIDLLEQNKAGLQSAVKQAKSKILDLAIHGKLVPQDPSDEPASVLLKCLATSDNRPYEKMEEPFAIPDSWVWCRLGEICDFIGGGTPDKSNVNYWDGNINWASVKDIKEKYLYTTEDKITEEGVKNSSTNIAKKDDLILVTRISPGKVIISKIKTAINQDLKIVVPKIAIEKKFLYFFFQKTEKEFISNSSGTTVKGIKLDYLSNYLIPLPPLAEQKKIVSKIDELFQQLVAISEDIK